MQEQTRRFVNRVVLNPTTRVAWDSEEDRIAVYRSR